MDEDPLISWSLDHSITWSSDELDPLVDLIISSEKKQILKNKINTSGLSADQMVVAGWKVAK